MLYRNNRNPIFQAMSLLEVLVAVGVMAIIFAVIIPQLRVAENSWDSKVGSSETLQNGRVLIDHINRNLSKAIRITAVSGPAETNGYIEFIDNDANNVRYEINSTSNYVEFGPPGNLNELAGPVSHLAFSCYGSSDFITPITDVNSIRFIKVKTILKNQASLDQDMTFSTQAYIRTNALPAVGGSITKVSEPWLEFDTAQGMEPALVHMSGNKFLCAYRGNRDDGWACILTVNPADWSISPLISQLEYDTKQGITPALAKIDDTHFLCTYQGDKGDGWACLIYESSPGFLAAGPKLEFDTADCINPSMCNIITQGDDHYLLCAYAASYEVRTVVLKARINDIMMVLSAPGADASFGASFSPMPALAKIDDSHYLCVYQGQNGGVHGGAVVLTIDEPVSGDINVGTHFDFLGESAGRLELLKIDDTHYLCTYETSNDGRATVLTVNTSTWTVTKEPGPDFLIDLMSTSTHALCQVDSTSFLCAYPALSPGGGKAVVLTVNAGDSSISKGTPCTFEPTSCLTTALCQIDSSHYLCAYRGVDGDGFVGVLELSGGLMP